MSNLPTLPAGDASFVSIRENNCLYVDKTRYIAQMIQEGSYYFLARPRRFGKSLTISTFQALFSGRKDLFVGLDIEKYLDNEKFLPGPVICLDMSGALVKDGIDGMNRRIKNFLAKIARDNHVELCGEDVDIIFSNLITDLHEKYGKVIILVDEYDYPVIDAMRKKMDIEIIKNNLRDFFTQIKINRESIRFVFLTGVSRFSRMGIFSALNNIDDISLQKDYGTMLGYTHEEIVTKFESYIEESAKALKTNSCDLINNIRDYYDGFCFDGEDCVYNPYSTLLFFRHKDFERFWFVSGTPSIVAEHIKRNKVTVEQFKEMKITKSFAQEPGELNESSTASYLYQS
ncbi:MAG: AAA family ATPase, partial [Desulfovibrio sp.]|nr:AAA family ATPase [Desulfovibrio sp.]